MAAWLSERPAYRELKTTMYNNVPKTGDIRYHGVKWLYLKLVEFEQVRVHDGRCANDGEEAALL